MGGAGPWRYRAGFSIQRNGKNIKYLLAVGKVVQRVDEQV